MNTPIKVTTIPVDRVMKEVLISFVSNHITHAIISVNITPENIEAYGLVGVIQSCQLINPIKLPPFSLLSF